MKKPYNHAFKALEKMGVPVYKWEDTFRISAEHESSYMWADYYVGPSIPSWDFGINPKIDRALAKYGLFCEWINPGEIGVWKI
jgi:hypothetical protein